MEWFKGILSDILDWIKGLYDKLFKLIDFIADFAEWLVNFFAVILETLVDLLLSVALDLLGFFLDAAVSILNSLPIPFNPSTYYQAIPDEVSAIMSLVGFPQATAMIVTALLIRIGLQLIPFTRLGS